MIRVILFSAIACLSIVAGCTTAAKPPTLVQSTPPPANAGPPQAAHEDDGHDAPRISLADAKKDFDNGTAVFIDTHVKQQYDNEHIPGAINVQANLVKEQFDRIPKGKKLIAYCS